jgi:hypothetical protein
MTLNSNDFLGQSLANSKLANRTKYRPNQAILNEGEGPVQLTSSLERKFSDFSPF